MGVKLLMFVLKSKKVCLFLSFEASSRGNHGNERRKPL